LTFTGMLRSPAATEPAWKLRWVVLVAFLATGAILLGWDRIEHARALDASDAGLHRIHAVRGISTGVLVSVGISWALLRNRRSYEKRMLALYRELVHRERMAAIGELAGGVAHEIRNPLAGISGALAMLARETPLGDDTHEVMDEIQRQIRRMNQLVEDLLSFSRPTQLHPEWIHVHPILRQAVDTIQNHLADAAVDVILDLDDRVPEIYADARDLEQAFENLVLNAFQAATDGGKIEVKTKLTEHSVHVSVRDTGVGIEPDVMPRIFEPFFTTKARGTGLGLPLVRRAVENNGGEIAARSSPTSGTVFELSFPVSADGRDARGERAAPGTG